MDIYQIIKKPSMTEKSGQIRDKANFYTFQVDKNASKKEIKIAVQEIFKVHVLRVNTVMMPGKSKKFGRSASEAHRFKKAIVKIKAGEKIEIVEGV